MDLDDTLIASRSAIWKARWCVAARVFPGACNELRRELLNGWQRLGHYFSFSDHEAICRVLAREFDIELGHVDWLEMRALYEDEELKGGTLFPGIVNLLEELSRCGVALGMVSNGNATQQRRKLENHGLWKYFAPEMLIIEERDSSRGKPYWESFRHLCMVSNTKPGDAVAVGDRATDVIAANMAGCISILFYGRSVEARLPAPTGMLQCEVPTFACGSIDGLVQIMRLLGVLPGASGRGSGE